VSVYFQNVCNPHQDGESAINETPSADAKRSTASYLKNRSGVIRGTEGEYEHRGRKRCWLLDCTLLMRIMPGGDADAIALASQASRATL
jgi:hypothetical protein